MFEGFLPQPRPIHLNAKLVGRPKALLRWLTSPVTIGFSALLCQIGDFADGLIHGGLFLFYRAILGDDFPRKHTNLLMNRVHKPSDRGFRSCSQTHIADMGGNSLEGFNQRS
jgi:hypothetical protein